MGINYKLVLMLFEKSIFGLSFLEKDIENTEQQALAGLLVAGETEEQPGEELYDEKAKRSFVWIWTPRRILFESTIISWATFIFKQHSIKRKNCI